MFRKKTKEETPQGPKMKTIGAGSKDAVKRGASDDGDFDFMNDVAAALLEQTPARARSILWAAVFFLGLALAWASIAEVDELTRGEGKVIPSSKLQVIQNLEGGIVAEILVREGAVVEKNQILLRIDDTRFASSFQESELTRSALKAKVSRLRAEAEGSSFKPPEGIPEEHRALVQQEKDLYDSRKRELDQTKRILKDQVAQTYQELAETKTKKGQIERSYNLLAEELRRTKPLLADGAISEVEILRLERQVNDLKGEMEVTAHAITRVQSKYSEVRRKLEEAELSFQNEARKELNEVQSELARMEKSGQALEDRVARTTVRSPVKGRVQRVHVNTVGGVVQPGMDLLEIVPLDDKLQVEAKIKPTDIAFLKGGQKATVKFTAYDFAVYGGLEGDVVSISPDSITDERGDTFYLVKVETDKSYLEDPKNPGEKLEIISGMVASVDILTGKKTILDYLLKPILKAKDRALTER